MAQLEMSLLGTVRILRDDQPVLEHTYAKVVALLAWLAVESDRPHQRATLAGLLWPEEPEALARQGLRQALSTIHRLVDQEPSPPCLLVTRHTVAFNIHAGHLLDIRFFLDAIAACAGHKCDDPVWCSSCTRRLERAATLYRGDFLAGFSVPDSDAYEEWIHGWRQRLRVQVIGALDDLASCYENRGDRTAAIQACRRQLELDPYLETSHRRLMTLLWHDGNRAGAIRHYATCQQILEQDLGIAPAAETVALYEEILRDSRSGSSRREPPRNRDDRSTLPVPLARFVGRERDLESIFNLLEQPECRLLTIAGPGGSGKTRVAIRIASDIADRSMHQVSFIDLESVRSPSLIVPAIAAQLGLELRGRESLEQRLLGWLRERQLLLVLDGAEHLVDHLALIPAMLAAAPGLTVLVTSRARLNLAGESVYKLRGMTVPDDAMALLDDRLRQARSGSAIQPHEQADAREICALVDGLPLGIELAAAWANTLTLSMIADGIRQNIDFLALPPGNQPGRQQSIRAVFNSSWELLTSQEQSAWRRLSVFDDDFSLDAARQVCGTSLQALSTLIGKSLVVQLPSGRYRLQRLLVQFGDELLRHDPEDHRDQRCAHARYYLGLMGRQEQLLTGREQEAALRAINADLRNISSAWSWALEHGLTRELVAAAPALWLSLVIRGQMRQGELMFGAVLDSVGRSRSPEDPGTSSALLLAMAQVYAGGFRSGLGRYDEAIALISDGITGLRPLVAGRLIGLTLNMLAAALSLAGRVDEARACLHESLEECRRVHDTWGMAFSLNDLGMDAHLRRDDEGAERYCEQSRTLFRESGDRRGQALAAHTLGIFATHRGEYQRAKPLHEEALAHREASEDSWGITMSLVRIGEVTRLTGDADTARAQLTRALALAWESAVVPELLDALVELIALDILTGDDDRAAEMLSPIAAHPALPDDVRERLRTLARSSDLDLSSPIDHPDRARWAIRTVEDIARSLVSDMPPS